MPSFQSSLIISFTVSVDFLRTRNGLSVGYLITWNYIEFSGSTCMHFIIVFDYLCRIMLVFYCIHVYARNEPKYEKEKESNMNKWQNICDFVAENKRNYIRGLWRSSQPHAARHKLNKCAPRHTNHDARHKSNMCAPRHTLYTIATKLPWFSQLPIITPWSFQLSIFPLLSPFSPLSPLLLS